MLTTLFASALLALSAQQGGGVAPAKSSSVQAVASATEPGFLRTDQDKFSIQVTREFTVTEAKGNLKVSIPIPPNLPTQEVLKFTTHVAGATVVATYDREVQSRSSNTGTGQWLRIIEIKPTAKKVLVTHTTDFISWRQLPGLSQEPVPAMPPFMLGEDRPNSPRYNQPGFTQWLEKDDVKIHKDEELGNYLQRLYGIFDKKWNGSPHPPLKDDSLEPMVKVTTLGCQEASRLFVGILRNQGYETFQALGYILYPIAAPHAFAFLNVPGAGWLYVDPTMALNGPTTVVPDRRAFVHHAVVGGYVLAPNGTREALDASGNRFTCNISGEGNISGNPYDEKMILTHLPN